MGGLVAAHFSPWTPRPGNPERGHLARMGIATSHIPEASG